MEQPWREDRKEHLPSKNKRKEKRRRKTEEEKESRGVRWESEKKRD